MSWEFQRHTGGDVPYKDESTYTVSSQGSLTHLQIFVREVLQNPLDVPTSEKPIVVEFRATFIDGSAKKQFLDAFGWDAFAPHLRSSRDAYLLKEKGRSALTDPDELEDERGLMLLYVEDFGTKGLVGPETNAEAHQFAHLYNPPHCFLGLCVNTGDNQKASVTSLGTYGFGKSVLWKNSGLKTVLFYSRLSEPYESPGSGRGVDARLIGQARLTPYWKDDELFVKPQFFCAERPEGAPTSFHNSTAESMAESLGFSSRDRGQFGTSILVVDMLDPDDGEPLSSAEELAEGIRDAAERFFWPAIVDGRLIVRTVVESSGGRQVEEATPMERKDLKEMISAYTSVRRNQPTEGVMTEVFDVTIPKGPREDDSEKIGSLCVATVIAENADEAEEYKNRVALIRGAGMVVGYQSPRRKGLNARDYFGVVVGGRAYPGQNKHGDEGQARCEQLLALAEPVTHDKWTDKADPLKGWRAAPARIREIHEKIADSVTRSTCDTKKPEGEAAPLLGKLFPLSGGSEPGIERDLRIEVLNPGTRNSEGSSDAYYTFHCRLGIPGRADFKGVTGAIGWKVQVRFGYVTSGPGLKLLGYLDSRFEEIKKGTGDWTPLDVHYESAATYSGAVEDEWQTVELRGRTERVPLSLDATRRYAMQVSTSKSAEMEVDDEVGK